MNICIHDVFDKRLSDFMAVKTEEIRRTGRKEILSDLLEEYKDFLSLWLVEFENAPVSEEYTTMYKIGETEFSIFLYKKAGDFYAALASFRHRPVPVIHHRAEDISASDAVAILIHLNRAVRAGKIGRIVCPPGFFIFKYKAQWAAGGYEDKPIIRMKVIRADSAESAVSEFQKEFRKKGGMMRENHFEMFSIFSGLKDEWRMLKVQPYNLISDMDLPEVVFSLV